MHAVQKFTALYGKAAELLSAYLGSLSLLVTRLLVAKVFLDSGLTKWLGPFQFNPDKYDLFLYEFFCPDPPRAGALQLCSPDTLDYVDGSIVVKVIETLAVSAGVMEVAFPVLLILGLFSRFAAIALMGMTLFIQLAVFPSWDHWWNPASWWALALLVVLAHGPGKWSLDHLFKLERGTTGN